MTLEATSKHLRSTAELLLLIPIRSGFVEKSSRTMSYATRLRNLLELLGATFPFSAEQTLLPGGSVLERLQNIYSVQYAVVERFGRQELLVSVSFDSSWESYFQNLVDNVGALLDLVFSHCEDYDGHACADGYEAFTRWIRKYQIQSGLFYTVNIDRTVDDLRGRPGDDERQYIVSVAKDPTVDQFSAAAATKDLYLAVRNPALRKLFTSLIDLAEEFPKGSDPTKITRDRRGNLLDEQARYQAAMIELFRGIAIKEGELDSLKLLKEHRAQISGLLALAACPDLKALPVAQPVQADAIDLGNVQGNVLAKDDPPTTVGCLVMVQCRDAAELACLLRATSSLGWPTYADAREQDLRVNLGLTFHALERSGLDREALTRFPKEFREGMRARAGLLGDIGFNHPENWQDLEVNWPLGKATGRRVPLSAIDVVLSLQAPLGAKLREDDEFPWNKDHPLLPAVAKLHATIERHAHAEALPRILHVEPLRRREQDHFKLTKSARVESEPTPLIGADQAKSAYAAANKAALGEVLLGYPDRRGKTAEATRPSDGYRHARLFKDGTFLVLRKLEQDVERFETYLDGSAKDLGITTDEVRALIVGRKLDGGTLATRDAKASVDDFDYRQENSPVTGCPAFAHARRSNPRLGPDRDDPSSRWEPRIVRRSISYGTAYNNDKKNGTDRGLMFFAYNANIAQQFEVTQRWVAGGNSTAVPSAQSDLLLGVHRGQNVKYPVEIKGQLKYLATPPLPFVTLRWGLYLFVPSRDGIRHLVAAQGLSEPARDPERNRQGTQIVAQLESIRDPRRAREAWMQVVEEDAYTPESLALWTALREQARDRPTAYGVLVSDYQRATEVLSDDSRYSVREYRVRMRETMGLHYLGMDASAEQQELATPPNDYLSELASAGSLQEAAGSRAYLDAHQIATRWIDEASKDGGLVDLKRLARGVAVELADAWVGLPGKTYEEKETHLNQLMDISRYCFLPYPTDALKAAAVEGGRALRAAYEDCLPQSRMLQALLRAPGSYHSRDNIITAMIGALVGFAAPAVSNILSVLARLQMNGDLERLARSRAVLDQAAVSALVQRLMIEAPQPPVLYRTIVSGERAGEKIVIGLHSACMSAPHDRDPLQWIFGGDRGSAQPSVHGCPARPLGMAAIEGVVGAVLACSDLRPEGIFAFSRDGGPRRGGSEHPPAGSSGGSRNKQQPPATPEQPSALGASACPMSQTTPEARRRQPRPAPRPD